MVDKTLEIDFKKTDNPTTTKLNSGDKSFAESKFLEIYQIKKHLSIAPNYNPKNFFEQIVFLDDGSHKYPFFNINGVWINSTFKPVYSGIFASGAATYIKIDPNVTANSLIDVYAQAATIGGWTVSGANGSFTITSTKTETSNVPFYYTINNI